MASSQEPSTSSAGFPKPPESPAIQAKRKARVVSLSINHLHGVLQLWRCTRIGCTGPNARNGGFGGVKDDSAFVLPCGHYICGMCKEELLNRESDYKCGFDEGTGLASKCTSTCGRGYLKYLPLAQHIKEFLPLFWPQGISCYVCSSRGRQLDDQIRLVTRRSTAGLSTNRQIEFRFPRELHVACTNSECMQAERKSTESYESSARLNLGTRTVNFTTRPETCPGKKIFHSVVPMCMFCAESAHADHLADLRPISSMPHIIGRWADERDKNQHEDSTYYRKLQSAWHLAMLQPAPLKSLVKELLLCRYPKCGRAYGSDRLPVMLSCGHVVCAVCEENHILNHRPNKHPVNRCGRDDCLFRKEKLAPYTQCPPGVSRIPPDFMHLVEADFSDYKQCSDSDCTDTVSPDHYVKIEQRSNEGGKVFQVHQAGRCIECAYVKEPQTNRPQGFDTESEISTVFQSTVA
ncbi:hypothetical protein PFISCL1PPCAC_4624 [Pristionchus fissidentatus]|uniref:RING-type domain-containing protein n=1 Tax=Pristionchus fissidentatus TaxID=1538716 RepID=A0AAV5V189_9BILA|nr:hypothetical protein PFISCL1PPCAC_4624 [Pristionchus fissidentatus]